MAIASLPPDHVRIHLEERCRGRVIGGDCLRLDQRTSDRIDLDLVRTSSLFNLASVAEVRRIQAKAKWASFYEACRIPMRPRLTGNNIAIWRSDFEKVNGFDEQFVGWGLEDRDLQLRLHQVGVRARSILSRTALLHLWHVPEATFARNNIGTPNLRYYQRPGRPTFCVDGLVKASDETSVIPLSPPEPAQRLRRAA